MMQMVNGILILTHLLTLFIRPTTGQNPDTFCSRLYHSSIIVKDTLYVDAGELRERNATNGVGIKLQKTVDTIDLSKPWGNGDDPLWGHITKQGVDGSTPTSLNDGAIFSNGSSLYLFGGAVASNPGPHPPPPRNALWQYDIDQDQWSQASPRGDSVQRIILGTTAQSSSSQAYYLGGKIVPKSNAAFFAIPDAMPYLVQGLLEFDATAVEFKNISTEGLDTEGTVAGGFVELIESLGDQGVLIAFGGYKDTPGEAISNGEQDQSNGFLHRLLGTVSIFDIASNKWYQQDTSGDTPPWRYNGCTVVTSAPDKTSHSIYVFGGWGGTSDDSDGNVYVLSIPSFRWIRVTSNGDQRQRHQCHLLGGHTMLVVGGIQPRDDIMQPEDLSGCDSSSRFSQGLGIFSLNDHSWKTNYDPKDGAAAYQVHSSISAVIGGDENGGATTTAPSGGFSVPALGSLLAVNQSSNTTTPSSTPGSTSTSSPAATSTTPAGKKISGGAIAGIAIGAVVIICGLVGALIFLMLRRKRGQHSQSPPPSSAPIGRLGEMDAITHPTEMPGPRAEKALPEKPDDYKHRPQELMGEQKPAAGTAEQHGFLEPQEMDAQGGPERRGTPRGYRPY